MKGHWDRVGQAGRDGANSRLRSLASCDAVIYKRSCPRPTPTVKALTSLPLLLAGSLQIISKCTSEPL